MASLDLVVRGGRVATAGDVAECDIGVIDGRIAVLGAALPAGAREIDARGKIVTPGGIDAHCHLDQPMPNGAKLADDFYSGTVSAACGGTTTVIPFAAQQKGELLRAALDDYHRRAAEKPVVDYAFHLILTDPTEHVLGQELPALIREGYTSFKVYMTYAGLRVTDRQILDVLALARREGAMTMIHAENSDSIEWLTEQLVAAGKTQPYYHAVARPSLVEREATHRAVALAELVDVPFLLVHISGAEAVQQIVQARSRGLKVLAETCPQYLFLTADDLKLDDFEGAKCVCSPPPRDKYHQAAIWNGISNDIFDVFSSDHSPFRFDDPHGKKLRGERTPFTHIPNGVPGIETRMPLLFSEGVMKGRIALTRFVALTATNPARIYGLYPRKGTIVVGGDADLVIWDPERRITVTNGILHHNVDYTPYEGMELQGWPAATISRGEVICEDGALVVGKGRGQFLRCDPPLSRKAEPPPQLTL